MEILFGTKTASGSSPCLIKAASLTILCNAGVSPSQLTPFRPSSSSTFTPIRIQMPSLTFFPIHSVDVVLISNMQDLLGLPFLCFQGFKGRVFATLPISLLGKSVVLDTFEGIRRANADYPEESAPYTEKAVEKAMQLVTTVNYKEFVALSEVVKIRPVSSGFELGACNWNIFVGDTKATYLSLSSLISYRYPQELAQEEIFASDILILRHGIIRENVIPTEIFDYQLKRLWETINSSLVSDPRAKVVMPINVLQLLDMLDMFAYKVNANAEVILFTEICDALIGYPNSCCEYLSDRLKSKVLGGEEAFSYRKLMQQKQFNYYKDVLHMQKALGDRYKPLSQLSGKIFLITHSSLRIGEAPALIQGFMQYPTDSVFVILVDPLFANPETLAPFFQEKSFKTFFNPLDPRITVEDLQKMLGKCQKPQQVVYPEEYKGFIEVTSKHHQSYGENSVIQIPLKEAFIPVGIDKGFFEELSPDIKVRTAVKLNGNYAVMQKPQTEGKSIKELLADRISRGVSEQHFGKTKVFDKGFLEYIKQAGIGITQMEGNVYDIKREDSHGTIIVEESNLQIKCDFKELRELLCKLYNSYSV